MPSTRRIAELEREGHTSHVTMSAARLNKPKRDHCAGRVFADNLAATGVDSRYLVAYYSPDRI